MTANAAQPARAPAGQPGRRSLLSCPRLNRALRDEDASTTAQAISSRRFTRSDSAGEDPDSKLYSQLGEHVTEARAGGDVESGHAVTVIAPVLCAGVGVRCQSDWALRLASFRLDRSDLGRTALGVVTPRSVASSALVGLLSGRLRPAYGTLAILGYDMGSTTGRAAVRRQVGMASRAVRPVHGVSIRRFVDRAARRSGQPGSDRHLLVAAILDRLALTPWAEVSLNAAPELIERKARLAAACVHQPKLLVLDGLLDHLPPLDRTVLADVIRDVGRDTAVIALGGDAATLGLICDQVVTMTNGILVGSLSHAHGSPEEANTHSGQRSRVQA